MPYFFWTGLGIYKRKKESEQESNHTRVHEKKSSFKKLKKRFKLFLFVGSTNHTKLLKVKLDDISPNLKISFFSVRERFFFNEFFFSWTLSWSSARLRGRVRVFLDEFFFSWTRACLLSCSLSFFLL